MNGSDAKCPSWLVELLNNENGLVSFSKFMDWVLNDPENGIYGTGNLRIGTKGDFCTSPSLGPDFGYLLATQVIEWLEQLDRYNIGNKKLSIVEVGPGEGDLAITLIKAINEISPQLAHKVEYILIEENKGMLNVQKNNITSQGPINIRWSNLNEIANSPVIGVVIANEVLDAFPVERFVHRHHKFYTQGVSLYKENNQNYISFVDMPLSSEVSNFLLNSKDILGMEISTEGLPDGWSSEWHCNLSSWFRNMSEILEIGPLLIIDYALEARRYYSKSRLSGTLLSYRSQKASNQILNNPGLSDITAHLCMESLTFYAQSNGWDLVGETRQGQALLALGLAEKLFSLQKLPVNKLSIALERREALLRLVDPAGLGDFRWILFNKSQDNSLFYSPNKKFLLAPH